MRDGGTGTQQPFSLFPPLSEGYVKHASVEGIEAELKADQAEYDRLSRRIKALVALKHHRLSQIEEGAWPTM